MADERQTENDAESVMAQGPRLRLFGRSYRLPATVLMRRIAGITLVFLGFLGFLPVLGFWMIPLGLVILSQDSHAVRRWRRQVEVWWGRKRAGGRAPGDGDPR